MNKTDFIRALPKAELHLHIEGSLEPEMLIKLAKRNNITLPFETVEQVRAAYDFGNLQDFLDIYYQGMGTLLVEQDFYDLTMAYIKRVAVDNVRHVEIFFDPQGHTSRSIDFAIIVGGITRALTDAKTELGITSGLILSFLRHLSEEDAFKTLAEADSYLDHFVAVGLDSSELGNPPSKFTAVFAKAKSLGLKLCAHAGEEGPPEYIRDTLDILKVDRLDHGNRAMEDSDLLTRLVDMGITLTICPLSNLRLKGVPSMDVHPIKKMLELGLNVTLNSDDPAYFGGYMNDNFEAVDASLDLSYEQLATLAKNSFKGSFLSEAEIAPYITEIDSLLAQVN